MWPDLATRIVRREHDVVSLRVARDDAHASEVDIDVVGAAIAEAVLDDRRAAVKIVAARHRDIEAVDDEPRAREAIPEIEAVRARVVAASGDGERDDDGSHT